MAPKKGFMPPKKCPSGSAKRKRRRETNALIESQRGALDKFLKNNTSTSNNPDELALVLVEEQTNDDLEEKNIDINMDDNNEIASEMGVEPSLPIKRKSQRKKHFDEIDYDEAILQAEDAFKVNYFLVMVDMAITSLKSRFEELQSFQSIFGFLMSSVALKSLDGSRIKDRCTKLAHTLSLESGACDVELNDLISELGVLQYALPNKSMTGLEIFEYVRAADCYPNIYIAYRILFTLPVTVASAERSFSKLKLLKNHLRSTMSQERLNGLATICIEKKLLDEIDIDTIINDFTSRSVRRNF